jgi:hypothetical protein
MNEPMNDLQAWQECNARYLADGVAWVRHRLESVVQNQLPSVQPARSENAGPGVFAWSTDKFIALPAAATSGSTGSQPSFPANAEPCEPPSALEQLSERFGLSRFEQQVLLLCAAVELHTSIAGLCAAAQNDSQRAYPTFALALALFDDPAWDALVPERPLRYWRLLEINQPGATALTNSPLRADERIVHYLKGANYLDDRLTSLLSPLYLDSEPGDELAELPASQEQAVELLLRYWRQTPSQSRLPVAQLPGPDVPSKHLVAHQAAARLGRQLCRLTAEMLPANYAEAETLARLWQRESLLLPLAL